MINLPGRMAMKSGWLRCVGETGAWFPRGLNTVLAPGIACFVCAETTVQQHLHYTTHTTRTVKPSTQYGTVLSNFENEKHFVTTTYDVIWY